MPQATKDTSVDNNVTSDDVTAPLLSTAPSTFETPLSKQGVKYNSHSQHITTALIGEKYEHFSGSLYEKSSISSPEYHEKPRSNHGSGKYKTLSLSTHATIESLDSGKCNNTQTLMNIIKGTIGTGILSLPYAFKSSGIWVGLIGFLLIASASVHCMHILITCVIKLEDRIRMPMKNYQETVYYCFKYGPPQFRSFAPHIKSMVTVCIHIMQCGFCCIYIVWVATNVKPVVDQYWPDSPDVRVFMTMVLLLLLPYLAVVKSLRALAIFSAIANVCYVVGLTIIFQNILQDIPDVTNRPTFASWSTLPMFFGTSVFSYESISLVVPIRNKMKHPEDLGGWAGVLNLGMVILTAIYAATGFYGYLKFGENIKEAITLNLPDSDWLYMSVNLIFATAMFISVGVQFYVPITVIWPAVEAKLPGEGYAWLAEALTRSGLIVIIFAVGVVVPHIELLMSLIGSLFGSLLAIILPITMELMSRYEERTLTWVVVLKDCVIMLVGLAGFATGSYTSIVDIIDTF